jgi:hypothetical protein
MILNSGKWEQKALMRQPVTCASGAAPSAFGKIYHM